jgi:DNA-binding SARP family transcriptional activator
MSLRGNRRTTARRTDAPAAAPADIRAELLGPLRMSSTDARMAPVAPKPRQILALLTLNHSRVVPVSTMIDELWDGKAPRTARTAVQIYVREMRKRLAELTGQSMDAVGREILRTARDGYEFAAQLTRCDLRTYRQLERQGLAAMARGDLVSAAKDFRVALSLWRGPALADVEPGPTIRAAVAGLEQSRATMLDYRIELELRFGRHREILGELADLVSHDRFNEDLHAQFIVALYRSGYRTRALEVFHRLRKDMVGRFGLDPTPKLHHYYRAVLASDSVLNEMPVLPLPSELAA